MTIPTVCYIYIINTGMLPPFTVQSEDNRAMARHCSVGIEPRISAERLILLDTQVRHFFLYIIEVSFINSI